MDFPGGSDSKASVYNVEDLGYWLSDSMDCRCQAPLSMEFSR